jgi:hypothetical protein
MIGIIVADSARQARAAVSKWVQPKIGSEIFADNALSKQVWYPLPTHPQYPHFILSREVELLWYTTWNCNYLARDFNLIQPSFELMLFLHLTG